MKIFRDRNTFPRLRPIHWIVACSLLVIFYVVIYPILAMMVMGRDEYRGRELYTSDVYLLYDSGSDFKTAVNTLDFTSDHDVWDFVYYNYPRQDHLLYGKQPDFYVLDFDVGDDFENVYDRYWNENAVNSDYGDYSIMLHQIERKNNHYNQLYLAFYEKAQLVRIIYRTGTKEWDNKPYIDNSVWSMCDDW